MTDKTSALPSKERALILRLRSDLAQLVVDYEDVPDATDREAQTLFGQAQASIRAADEWLDSCSSETRAVPACEHPDFAQKGVTTDHGMVTVYERCSEARFKSYAECNALKVSEQPSAFEQSSPAAYLIDDAAETS